LVIPTSLINFYKKQDLFHYLIGFSGFYISYLPKTCPFSN
jgi:hypothetical protein